MMGISIWQLAIILLIVALLFGTKRLRGLGSDVGGAITGFRRAIQDNDDAPSATATESKERQQR